MSPEFMDDLQTRTCTECFETGRLMLMPNGYFVCRACSRAGIDPYAIGPFDQPQLVIERFGGEPVMTRVVEAVPTLPATTGDDFDKNIAGFYKYLREEGRL